MKNLERQSSKISIHTSFPSSFTKLLLINNSSLWVYFEKNQYSFDCTSISQFQSINLHRFKQFPNVIKPIFFRIDFPFCQKKSRKKLSFVVWFAHESNFYYKTYAIDGTIMCVWVLLISVLFFQVKCKHTKT